MAFQKATKQKMKLRCALDGPPGSGKTYTALSIGRALIGDNGRIAVIDTERGSAAKYSDDFEFDVVELDTYAPATFVEMIREAEAQGYDLLIIDSLSHAWMGTDGMLDQVDKIAKRKQYGSNFPAWKDANPQERLLWDTMLGCNMHLIVTLRTKTEYVIEEVAGRDGKKRSVPKKVGLAPIQREGLEYEFDVVADVTMEHDMVVTKTRCKQLTDGVYHMAGAGVASILSDWLGYSQPIQAKAPQQTKHEPQPEPERKPTMQTDGADRAVYLHWIKEAAGRDGIGIPKPVLVSLATIRGYKTSADMPTDVLFEFASDLRTLAGYVEDGTVPREHVVDQLQRSCEGDPIKPLINACIQAKKLAEEAA